MLKLLIIIIKEGDVLSYMSKNKPLKTKPRYRRGDSPQIINKNGESLYKRNIVQNKNNIDSSIYNRIESLTLSVLYELIYIISIFNYLLVAKNFPCARVIFYNFSFLKFKLIKMNKLNYII